jgi:menaquinone-dependent protoporphyrinogen IX oxidase
MKTIVVYYSRKGSNRYLAEKIAKRLNCDMEKIRPRLNVFILFLMKINFGNWRLKHRIKVYDRVILCGPIWMGSLIPPLRSFITRYFKSINQLVFVTCCGSSDEKKDEKFGHGFVFKEVESLLQGKCILCQAFPVVIVLPVDKREDPDTFLKTHLNDENFVGEIQERFENFIRLYGKLDEV